MKDLREAIDKAVFADVNHEERYELLRERILRDPTAFKDNYRESLCYLLALNLDCYNHITDLYDFEENCIIPDAVNSAWQTSSSRRTTDLAFNLFTGSCLWCEGEESRCAVSEIFNCDYAPYFMEAVKIWAYAVF